MWGVLFFFDNEGAKYLIINICSWPSLSFVVVRGVLTCQVYRFVIGGVAEWFSDGLVYFGKVWL